VTPRRTEEPPCPNEAAHTGAHLGYSGVVRMSRTHQQHECPGCRRWVIWTPLPPGSLITCWHCGERNVDPATLGEDDGIPDEPLCAGCGAVQAAQVEADRLAAAQRRERSTASSSAHRTKPAPDPGIEFAREVERVLVAADLIPSFTYWADGRQERTPGWIIEILDPVILRVRWHAETNRAYRIRKLGAAADVLEAVGLLVTRLDDGDESPARLVVTRAPATGGET
jgi:hypothetical protein